MRWRAGFVPLKEDVSRSRRTEERTAEEARGEDGAATRQEELREEDEMFPLSALVAQPREVQQTSSWCSKLRETLET